jgi:putative beta-lysine N-acetyltransferase
MEDRVETVGRGSVIQHGKYNDRIYLMKLMKEDCPEILGMLRSLARKEKYTKIFGKVPASAAPLFFSDGYMMEAFIPGFYQRSEAAFFVSKYLDSDRLMEVERTRLEELGALLEQKVEPKEQKGAIRIRGRRFSIRKLELSDADQIARIYREVFKSYPFPIHDPGYIARTMEEEVSYFGVKRREKIIALASSEMDLEGSNAEMTDFATLPDYRGNHLAQLLLRAMEKEMKRTGIQTLYTIARLHSPAMNRTFLKARYHYAGTLIRNTQIAGNVESMNVYYKHL